MHQQLLSSVLETQATKAHHSESFCTRRASTTGTATAGFFRSSSPICNVKMSHDG